MLLTQEGVLAVQARLVYLHGLQKRLQNARFGAPDPRELGSSATELAAVTAEIQCLRALLNGRLQ